MEDNKVLSGTGYEHSGKPVVAYWKGMCLSIFKSMWSRQGEG